MITRMELLIEKKRWRIHFETHTKEIIKHTHKHRERERIEKISAD